MNRRSFIKFGGTTLMGALLAGYKQPRVFNTGDSRFQDNRPNVILIVLDTVRAQNLNVYGYQRLTSPNIKELSEMGVRFEQAYATAPWTLPSHASMFTGYWPHEHKADWGTALGGTLPVLAEALFANGYETAGFVANLNYCTESSGLNRGFNHYEDYPISLGQILLSSEVGRLLAGSDRLRNLVNHHELFNRKSAENITSSFLDWLSPNRSNRFFAFLNYYDAHQPYFPPHPYDLKYGPKQSWRRYQHGFNQADPANMYEMSPEDVQEQIDAYDGAISYIDDQIGRLIAELRQLHLLENTLIIITSDHGEQFGEHGLFGHTNSLYVQTLNVPLILVAPNLIPQDLVVSDPVSLRDIPSTVSTLLGSQEKHPFPGVPLTRFWRESNMQDDNEIIISELSDNGYDWQDWYPVTLGNIESIVREDCHFILRGDGKGELYQLIQDPFEEHDIADTAYGRQVSQEYRQLLRKYRAIPHSVQMETGKPAW